MASYLDVSSVIEYRHGSNRFRLNPTGYKLLIQQYVSGAWVTVGTWKRSPLSNTNNFRFVIVSGQLLLRQLRSGGSWRGSEGSSFDTLEYFNYS